MEAWFELPQPREIGRSDVCVEKGARCFLTLRSVAFHSARLTCKLEKHLHSIHANTAGEDVQEHTQALVLQAAAVLENRRYSGPVFDFLKSEGSPRSSSIGAPSSCLLSLCLRSEKIQELNNRSDDCESRAEGVCLDITGWFTLHAYDKWCHLIRSFNLVTQLVCV